MACAGAVRVGLAQRERLVAALSDCARALEAAGPEGGGEGDDAGAAIGAERLDLLASLARAVALVRAAPVYEGARFRGGRGGGGVMEGPEAAAGAVRRREPDAKGKGEAGRRSRTPSSPFVGPAYSRTKSAGDVSLRAGTPRRRRGAPPPPPSVEEPPPARPSMRISIDGSYVAAAVDASDSDGDGDARGLSSPEGTLTASPSSSSSSSCSTTVSSSACSGASRGTGRGLATGWRAGAATGAVARKKSVSFSLEARGGSTSRVATPPTPRRPPAVDRQPSARPRRAPHAPHAPACKGAETESDGPATPRRRRCPRAAPRGPGSASKRGAALGVGSPYSSASPRNPQGKRLGAVPDRRRAGQAPAAPAPFL